MRRDKRTQRTPAAAPRVRATTGLPSSGFALIVDGQAKAEFETRDQALKAATDLKLRFPDVTAEQRAESEKAREMLRNA